MTPFNFPETCQFAVTLLTFSDGCHRAATASGHMLLQPPPPPLHPSTHARTHVRSDGQTRSKTHITHTHTHVFATTTTTTAVYTRVASLNTNLPIDQAVAYSSERKISEIARLSFQSKSGSNEILARRVPRTPYCPIIVIVHWRERQMRTSCKGIDRSQSFREEFKWSACRIQRRRWSSVYSCWLFKVAREGKI